MTKRKKKTIVVVPRRVKTIRNVDELLVHLGLDPNDPPRAAFISSTCRYADLYGCYGLAPDDPEHEFPRELDKIDTYQRHFIMWVNFVREGAVTFYDKRSDTYITEGGSVVGVEFGAYIDGIGRSIGLGSLTFPFAAGTFDRKVRELDEAATKAAQDPLRGNAAN